MALTGRNLVLLRSVRLGKLHWRDISAVGITDITPRLETLPIVRAGGFVHASDRRVVPH
jgi:hypothetical protein